MKMNYNPITVYIIDDEFPKTPEFIDQLVYNSAIDSEKLYHLAITHRWKGLESLQQLIKDIIASKPFIDGMINVCGFTKPTQALSSIEENKLPDIVIYDWEYDMPKPKESQDWLLEILNKTKAFVFVYSKIRDELPPFLNKAIFDKYADRFQLFKKGNSDSYIFSSEEFIHQYILSLVSSTYLIKVQGIEVTFSSNGYLQNSSDILHLEKILGRNFILDQIKELNFSISQESVEKIIEKANGIVLFDEKTSSLITTDSSLLIKKLNPKQELTYLEVLKKYGLIKLKELLEIGYNKV